MKSFKEEDEEGIRELFMGRRVVKVELFEESIALDNHWGDFMGKMTLDNGQEVWVAPNEGCGGCPAGHYDLTSLERVDNIITWVGFETETKPITEEWQEESEHTYRIFVLAGHERINALTVTGDDGNGYYGTGYHLVVLPG